MKIKPQNGFTQLESSYIYNRDDADKTLVSYKKDRVRAHSFLTGFTLLELIVVISIMAIAASIGISILWNFNKDLGVRSTTNYVISLLRFAQSKAKTDSTPTSFVFDSKENNIYVLFTQQVGMWHFEDLNGNITSGAFERHAKVTGAALASGKIGMALQFSGRDYIECPEIPLLNPEQGFAIEFWLYPKALGSEQFIFTKGQELAIAIGSDGEINAKVDSITLDIGDLVLPLETWVRVKLAYVKNKARLFVQDNEVASKAGSAKWMNDSQMIIGALVNKKTKEVSEGFVGLIDELKVGLVISQKEYKLSQDVKIAVQGIKPNKEGQFIIDFDQNGRSSEALFKVTAEGGTKSVRVDINGWAEIVKE